MSDEIRRMLPLRSDLPENSPPMAVRMVALDVDGTLLENGGEVSERVQETLAQVQRLGVHIVLTTSRPPRSTRRLVKTLNIDDPVICYSGGVLFDPYTNDVMSNLTLDPAVARECCLLARKAEANVHISLEIEDRWYTDRTQGSEKISWYQRSKPFAVDPLEAFLGLPINMILMTGTTAQLVHVQQVLRQHFGDQLNSCIGDDDILEMTGGHVSKGIAVETVAERLRIPLAAVMAIGDAPHDVPMFQVAGFSVAMGNAWSSTKQQARVTVPALKYDGVAFALEQWVLRDPRRARGH